MINDVNCDGGKEFQHNYFVLGYKSLLHIKCSQWVVNQQPETLARGGGGLAAGRGLVSGSGFGCVRFFPPHTRTPHIYFVSFFGCAGVRFWTAELPACKSIENNLLLLIISERSCAHACGEGLSASAGRGHQRVKRGRNDLPTLTASVLLVLGNLVTWQTVEPAPTCNWSCVLSVSLGNPIPRSVLFACGAHTTNKQINIQTRPRLLTVVP